jgi:hypothetical protein
MRMRVSPYPVDIGIDGKRVALAPDIAVRCRATVHADSGPSMTAPIAMLYQLQDFMERNIDAVFVFPVAAVSLCGVLWLAGLRRPPFQYNALLAICLSLTAGYVIAFARAFGGIPALAPQVIVFVVISGVIVIRKRQPSYLRLLIGTIAVALVGHGWTHILIYATAMSIRGR